MCIRDRPTRGRFGNINGQCPFLIGCITYQIIKLNLQRAAGVEVVYPKINAPGPPGWRLCEGVVTFPRKI